MPSPFDSQSLIEEEKKRNKDAETEGLKEQSYDEYVAEQEKIADKKKSWKETFDKADQAIREVDYMQEHGINKWFEAKKKQDPDFELPKPF